MCLTRADGSFKSCTIKFSTHSHELIIFTINGVHAAGNSVNVERLTVCQDAIMPKLKMIEFDNIQSSIVLPLHHPLIEHGVHHFNKAADVGPI